MLTFAVEVLPTLTNFKVDLATSDDCLHPDKPHLSMVYFLADLMFRKLESQTKHYLNKNLLPDWEESLEQLCEPCRPENICVRRQSSTDADSPLPLTLPASPMVTPKSVPRESECKNIFNLKFM